MKQIRLVPDPPFYNSVDIAVLDFPAGLDGALAYYHDWLYQVVKVHLAQDWACIGGMDEVFACIETALARYY